MKLLRRALCGLACLALLGCMRIGPGEDDLVRLLTGLQSKEAIAAGKVVDITEHRCKLMAHGQSQECKIDYVLKGKGAAQTDKADPIRVYLILVQKDGEWAVYSQRDEP